MTLAWADTIGVKVEVWKIQQSSNFSFLVEKFKFSITSQAIRIVLVVLAFNTRLFPLQTGFANRQAIPVILYPKYPCENSSSVHVCSKGIKQNKSKIITDFKGFQEAVF